MPIFFQFRESEHRRGIVCIRQRISGRDWHDISNSDGTVNAGSQPQATGGLFVTTGPASTALFAQTVDTSVYNYAIYGYSAGTLGYGVAAHGGTGVWGDGVRFGVIGNSTEASGIGGLFVNYDPDGKALVARMASNDEALTVLSGGNVGVRNSAPSEALDVNGNVKAVKFIGDGSMLTNLPTAGGTITGVAATSGLTGGGATGNVSIGIADHAVTNLMLQKNTVTVNPGFGLTDGGSITLGESATLSVDVKSVQKRVSGGCPGSAIQAVNEDGNVGCLSFVPMAGSGTPGRLSKFVTPTALGDSQIIENPINGTVTVGVLNEPNDATVSVGGIMVQASAGATPNIVAGFTANLGGSAVAFSGVTISGGGDSGSPNRATGSFASIGGGVGNTAGSSATIGGGSQNTAGVLATIGRIRTTPQVAAMQSWAADNPIRRAVPMRRSPGDQTTSLPVSTVSQPVVRPKPTTRDHLCGPTPQSLTSRLQPRMNSRRAVQGGVPVHLGGQRQRCSDRRRPIGARGGCLVITQRSQLQGELFRSRWLGAARQAESDAGRKLELQVSGHVDSPHRSDGAGLLRGVRTRRRQHPHRPLIDADGVALAGVQALYRLLLQKDEEIVRQQRELQKLRNDLDTVQNLVKQLSTGSGSGFNRPGGSDK